MKHLIVAPAWVGDMVMAHCLVQVLLDQDPQAQIHMSAPAATFPLTERMPGVTQGHHIPVVHGELGLGKRFSFAKQIRAENFDRAYVLPNSFKSALVPWLAKIETRVGWHGEARFLLLNDRRRLDPKTYPLMIERFMALGLPEGAPLSATEDKPYPLPRLEPDAQRAQTLVQELQLNLSNGVVALCPGAEFGPAKRWPADHYASVAKAALMAGKEVWLLGSPKDAPACEEIVEALTVLHKIALPNDGRLHNLAGRTRLLDAVDLLSLADSVVCNDSGLMHIACALDRQVVAVFGSTSPDFTPPLGAKAQTLQEPISCSPCFQRVCPLQHMNCLQQLAPARVVAALGL